MLTGIGLFLLLVIVLLAIPLTLTFQISHRQGLRGQLALEWAFGRVRLRIPMAKGSPAEPTPRAAGRTRRRSRGRTHPIALLRCRPFRRRMLRFGADLWHALRKRDIKLHLRLGLGDPADTGQLWAVVGPLAAMLAGVKDLEVEIEPEFLDAVFELDSRGTLRLIPLQILWLAVALLFSPGLWRGIRLMRSG